MLDDEEDESFYESEDEEFESELESEADLESQAGELESQSEEEEAIEETPEEEEEPSSPPPPPPQEKSEKVTPPFVKAADVPVTLCVELGRQRMSAARLLALQAGNVLDLGAREQGVILSVGGRAVGRGELVRLGDTIGVRITELS